jgi:UDP-N-acetylmuramoylalanine--D-glutamate ligase
LDCFSGYTLDDLLIVVSFAGEFWKMIDLHVKKNIVVVGGGISGAAAARFLEEQNHEVTVFDDALGFCEPINWPFTDAIVQSPGVPFMPHNRHAILKMADDHNVPVISCFDIFVMYNNPLAKIISITGTNGKSTVTALVNHILQRAGKRCAMGGNIGIPFCSLPDSDIYVLEMSSYEIAISAYMKSDIACITNINPDHLENHGTFQNYVNAKHKSLRHSKKRVISLEDQITSRVFVNQKNVIKVSNSTKDADIYEYEGVLFDENRAVLDMYALTNLIGRHNRQNVVFAYTICKEMGVDSLEMKKHIPSFEPLPHRMNIIKRISKITFINDSKATNPESTAQALDTFIGYRIFWLVGGRSKKASVDCVLSYLQYVQKIYLFGESQDEFAATFHGRKEYEKCQTLDYAVQRSFEDAVKEDNLSAVLLSPMCSSFDQFKNFEERGDMFCRLVDILGSSDVYL